MKIKNLASMTFLVGAVLPVVNHRTLFAAQNPVTADANCKVCGLWSAVDSKGRCDSCARVMTRSKEITHSCEVCGTAIPDGK
ncbi:MAG: hypothetical protein RLZ12_967 [Bacillota bacterium]|jgi:hypothetical protein